MYFHLLVVFIALALSPTYTRHAVTLRALTTYNIDHTTMADAWISIRHHDKRCSPVKRRGGARDGLQSLAAASREPPPPGSPIDLHNISSSTDNLLDTFLQGSHIPHSQCTPVHLDHANKVKVALKPRVLAPIPSGSKHFTHHRTHQHCLARATMAPPQLIAKLFAAANMIKTK